VWTYAPALKNSVTHSGKNQSTQKIPPFLFPRQILPTQQTPDIRGKFMVSIVNLFKIMTLLSIDQEIILQADCGTISADTSNKFLMP
jgi:hypothetical protein